MKTTIILHDLVEQRMFRYSSEWSALSIAKMLEHCSIYIDGSFYSMHYKGRRVM
jgi:hypothetical protein